MKRDMKLIVRILRCIRSRDGDRQAGFTGAPDFEPEVSEDVVRYHLDLCVGAGFLERRRESNRHATPTWRLTWQGHDWIEQQSDCK